MSALTRDALWNRLAGAMLVSGEIPDPAPPPTPWPVRAMLGAAGWIGAIFLLAFAGAAYAAIFRSAQGAIPMGVLCCMAAFGIFAGMPHNEFLEQFGFAVSLAGQAMLMYGFFEVVGGHNEIPAGAFLLMALTEAVLAIAVPNYIHRVFTTIAANFCLFIAAVSLGGGGFATAVAAVGASLIWLDQVRMAGRPGVWEPLGYGFAIALLHLDGSLMFGTELWSFLIPRGSLAHTFPFWIGPAAEGLVFIYVAWELRERVHVKFDSPGGIGIVAASVLLACFGLAAPGIMAAILVLVLAFANGNRVLMGLGILSFAGYLSHFYYQLSSTLLVKSAVLAATGAALLGVRWAITRFFPAEDLTNA